MSFFALILKNLLRRKTRTFLTILGISIGIATIIALGSIGEGLKKSMGDFLKVGGADFIVAQYGTADLALSSVSESRVDDILDIKGIEGAEGVLIGVVKMENIPFFLTLGVSPKALEIADIKVETGRVFKGDAEDEIILGKVAAGTLKKRVGDRIKLSERDFKIVGMYESGDIFQDGGSFLPLKVVQDMQYKKGKLSMIFVGVEEGADIKGITEEIEDKYKSELVTVKSVEEMNKIDQGTQFIDGAVWAISFLAIIVGGIGVMNTMIMSVFERTREIGVLRALGWKKRRVLTMILIEAFFIGILGAVLGTVLGLIAAKAMVLAPAVKGFLQPIYPHDLFVKAFTVALFVSLIGGFYPAYKASRLSPIEALRYE